MGRVCSSAFYVTGPALGMTMCAHGVVRRYVHRVYARGLLRTRAVLIAASVKPTAGPCASSSTQTKPASWWGTYGALVVRCSLVRLCLRGDLELQRPSQSSSHLSNTPSTAQSTSTLKVVLALKRCLLDAFQCRLTRCRLTIWTWRTSFPLVHTQSMM